MRFLSKKEVRSLILYSFAHIDRLELAGKFPTRVRLGPGRVGWVDEEVQEWMQQRISDRDKTRS